MISSYAFSPYSILSPSVEKLVYIHIYIFINNNVGFREFTGRKISPERGKYLSPGQRPGYLIAVIFKALKGRNMIIEI